MTFQPPTPILASEASQSSRQRYNIQHIDSLALCGRLIGYRITALTKPQALFKRFCSLSVSDLPNH